MGSLVILSSGAKSADAVIIDQGAQFYGILAIHDASANLLQAEIWDSPDSTLTGDIKLGELQIGASPAAGDLTQSTWYGPNGVTAFKGIYVDVTQAAGTILYYVYYG